MTHLTVGETWRIARRTDEYEYETVYDHCSVRGTVNNQSHTFRLQIYENTRPVILINALAPAFILGGIVACLLIKAGTGALVGGTIGAFIGGGGLYIGYLFWQYGRRFCRINNIVLSEKTAVEIFHTTYGDKKLLGVFSHEQVFNDNGHLKLDLFERLV